MVKYSISNRCDKSSNLLRDLLWLVVQLGRILVLQIEDMGSSPIRSKHVAELAIAAALKAVIYKIYGFKSHHVLKKLKKILFLKLFSFYVKKNRIT